MKGRRNKKERFGAGAVAESAVGWREGKIRENGSGKKQ